MNAENLVTSYKHGALLLHRFLDDFNLTQVLAVFSSDELFPIVRKFGGPWSVVRALIEKLYLKKFATIKDIVSRERLDKILDYIEKNYDNITVKYVQYYRYQLKKEDLSIYVDSIINQCFKESFQNDAFSW